MGSTVTAQGVSVRVSGDMVKDWTQSPPMHICFAEIEFAAVQDPSHPAGASKDFWVTPGPFPAH
jgi:hypothetical protein